MMSYRLLLRSSALMITPQILNYWNEHPREVRSCLKGRPGNNAASIIIKLSPLIERILGDAEQLLALVAGSNGSQIELRPKSELVRLSNTYGIL